MPEKNACILRTIDIDLQAAWANPRFISSNQGKNFNRKILIKIENVQVCVKNV